MQSNIAKKTSGQDLSAFQTILDFVSNIHEYFETDKHASIRPLSLYYRLISKMSLRDDDLILRHIQVFKAFCEANREQIRSRNPQLAVTQITFTDRIYIDMQYVLSKVDAESGNAVWEYLLAISAYVDPENKTKELLQGLKGGTDGGADALVEMMGPMMGEIMKSDLFNNLLSGSSNMDLGKLVQTMTGLISNVKTELENTDDPAIKQLLGLLPPQTLGGSH